MTKTEDRLREYFGAVADSVRPGNTPLLTPPRPSPRPSPLSSPRPRERQRRPKAASGHRGWQTWGVPLAAGASVLVVVLLAATLAGLTAGHRPAASSAATGIAAQRPRYYAEIDGSATGGSVLIHATSSGATIANVRKSVLLRDSALAPQPLGVITAVAAAPDDRTFYAEMLTANYQYWIFRFRVGGTGSVTGIARIRGGIVHGGYNAGIPSLTVSPDGERLALTTTSSAALSGITGGHDKVVAVQDEIVVIDLNAATQRAWQGGLYRTGRSFDIQSLSWSDGGRSLVFVPAWCSQPTAYATSCPYFVGSNGYSQVRLLNIGGGTSLAGSRVLLGAKAAAQQAVSDQHGHLDVLTLSGRLSEQRRPTTVTIEQFSAAGGTPRRVLYRHEYQGARYLDQLIGVYLRADPSGRYLLLGLEFDVSTVPNEVEWIDNGSARALKVGKEDAELLPDAW